MNNEPVAWMELYYGEPNNLSWTDAELRNSGEVYKTIPLYTHPSDRISELEQQLKKEIQARADALDDLNSRMMKFMKSYNEMAWKLEEVGGAYTHPVKELTNEEIGQIWKDCMESPYMQVNNSVGFARAILRKAQE